jgi:hypothetical protein
MLSAAGVRMDAEKETLFQTTLSLQDQLKESQVALLMEQVCLHRYLFLCVILDSFLFVGGNKILFTCQKTLYTTHLFAYAANY